MAPSVVRNGRASKAVIQHGTTQVSESFTTSPGATRRPSPGGPDWVVQKFGGTSLGKCATSIAEDIVLTGLNENRIAIVCSARSSKTKSEGTTNCLLRAARDVLVADSRKYVDIVGAMRAEHITIGRNAIDCKTILDQYIAHVDMECNTLLRILESAQFLEAVTNQTKDMIISTGEKLSCLFMTALLQTKGIKAVCVNLCDVLDLGTITELDERIYREFARIIGEEILRLGSDVVPVVTGFFGRVPGGLLEQVGRGYTDLCAALTAVGLGARELQIWKEVDGIFTADPRKVPGACLLDCVTPAEAAELTFYGSEVIHPYTMDQVISANIPIRIKNVMNPSSSGTVVHPNPADTGVGGSTGLVRNRSWSSVLDTRPKRPTAVTVKPGITVVNIHSRKRTRAHGFLASIFSILDRNGLSVDLVSSSEAHVSMAIHSEDALLAVHGEDDLQIESETLQSAVDSLKAWGDVDLVPGLAIISLVGRQLRSNVGISGHFFSTLGEHGINIEMISQGASEISIGCVIEERDANRALQIVHSNLFAFLE